MDFKDQIIQLGEKIGRLRDQIQTEEATKNAFIMPFLMTLGYDVFNPCEIVPEFTCDKGVKKGEKIDYAIMKSGEPILLIECKHWMQNLDVHDGQLLRYFAVSKAKFGLLTNGIEYRFYTDLDDTNKMDSLPFFEFNITDLRENQIEELKKFHKSYFDVDKICDSASGMKYTYELKKAFLSELNNPSEQLVKLFAKRVYQGVLTGRMVEQFSVLVKKSMSSVISDIIQERFKTAWDKEKEDSAEQNKTEQDTETQDRGIVTTEEELESFYIVKAILISHIPGNRISYRDAKTLFSILLDNNIRKPICKLIFSDKRKVLVLFEADRTEVRVSLESIDDIYKHADKLLNTLSFYEK
jgi:hypothetical protein